MFHRAFHRWPQLARPHRLQPQLHHLWLRSPTVLPSGSIEFGCLLGDAGAHDFGYAQRGTLNSTCATRDPSIYDHGRTTRGSGDLPASPSGYVRGHHHRLYISSRRR
jgi:hypothetical protein